MAKKGNKKGSSDKKAATTITLPVEDTITPTPSAGALEISAGQPSIQITEPPEKENSSDRSTEVSEQKSVDVASVPVRLKGSRDDASTATVETPDHRIEQEAKAKPQLSGQVYSSQDTAKSPEPEEPEEAKPTSPAAPTPAPAPKKRLTLQERLALAAKSGKSSKRTASSTTYPSVSESISKATSPEPRETPETSPPIVVLPTTEVVNTATAPSLDQAIETPQPTQESLFPSNYKDLGLEDLIKLIGDAQRKFTVLESKSKTLTEEKHSLQEKVKTLQSSAVSSRVSPAVSETEQLLKEKDDKIATLRREGEELSKKELKSNNTIKRLKAREADQEYEISELSKRLADLDIECKKTKDSLKKSLESEQQASTKVRLLQKQLDNEKESLKEEIAKNEKFSREIEELNVALVQERNKTLKEQNDLKRQLEKEKQKLVIVNEDHAREVSRLEEKIEQLRFQAENAQTVSSTNDEGYLKLLKQHDTLQKQYTSATENWQSIEASLMSKLSSLGDEVSALHTKTNSQETKNSILSKNLEEKISELDAVSDQLKSLKSEHAKLKIKLQISTKSLDETLEALETKDIRFSQEKSSLQFKIQSLEKQVKEMAQPQTLGVDIPVLSSSSPMSRNSSAISFRQRAWEGKDISLGESSTTPLQSRKASAAYINISQPDYFDERDDSLSDFGDNDTIDSPVSNTNTPRLDNFSSNTVGVGGSVQLLGKLSSQVRRLQTEISIMRDEVEKLTEDKKNANEEIIKLMKENEQVEAYKAKIAELEEEVEGYVQRHDKMLEILGEKSERVEELKADVQDLKDLCKLQVQQLVDMQPQ